MGLKDRSISFFAAAAVFLVFCLRPAYIIFLRRQLRAKSPAEWSQLSTNGSFTYLLPELVATRYHDEALYASRLRQVALHGLPYNPYWKNQRHSWGWLYDCVPFLLMGPIAWICGGNMTVSWILASAILGALWFLLFYKVFLWWSGRTAAALPLAFFSILFPDIYIWLLDVNFNWRVDWFRFSSIFVQRFSHVLPVFYRIPGYFLVLFLLCLLFLGTWRLLIKTAGGAAAAFLLGLGYGLLAFTHAFACVFGMATLSVLLAALFIFRFPAFNRRNACWIFAGSMVTLALYAFFAFYLVNPRARADSLLLLGLVSSRRFYLITIVHLLAAALGVFFLNRERDERKRAAWLMLICAQIAVFLCRNLQVLVGKQIEPFHYIQLGSFFGCLMLFLLLAEFLSAKPWWTRQRSGIACAAILLAALFYRKSAAEATYRFFGLPRYTEAALNWVRQETPPDSLFLSLSIETTELLPLYTSAAAQASCSAPTITGPFRLDEYYTRIAQLLKTSHANVKDFFQERWPLPAARRALDDQLFSGEIYHQTVNIGEAFEGSEWLHTFGYWDAGARDGPVLEARRRVKDLMDRVPPVPCPYYFWVNAKDEHLLLKSPEKSGGALAYQNPSVKIYYFACSGAAAR